MAAFAFSVAKHNNSLNDELGNPGSLAVCSLACVQTMFACSLARFLSKAVSALFLLEISALGLYKSGSDGSSATFSLPGGTLDITSKIVICWFEFYPRYSLRLYWFLFSYSIFWGFC